LLDAGLTPDPALNIEASFTVAGGERATEELLRRDEPPTAIFAACDEMAMGAMRALRQARMLVPDDVSVVGIDDHDLAAALGLTTVAQPAAEQGRLGAIALLQALADGITGPGQQQQLLPTRLVVRESTAPPGPRPPRARRPR
jgi:DNA-binding LacI/PurR family transcriptional regulator